MPTGRNRKAGFGWGTYGRGKRWGKADMSSKHIRSFSLTQQNSRYLDGVTKGHRSDAVNRALDSYRGLGSNVNELYENIGYLQTHIGELYEKLEKVTGSGEIADYEAQKVPPRGVIRRVFHYIRSFWL